MSARHRLGFALAALLFASTVGAAGIAPPPLRSGDEPLRIWGNAQLEPVVVEWTQALRRSSRDHRFAVQMKGSDVGMAGLYTGKADIALLGREATDSELKAFEWVFRYPPRRIEIGSGSLARSGQSPALAVLVHRDNPLRSIRIDQLAALLRGDAGSVGLRAWGQLGVDGDWALKPVALYASSADSGSGRFLRNRLLQGDMRLHWDALTEFPQPATRGSERDDRGRHIVNAVARDRLGLALTDLEFVDDRVRVVAVSETSGGEPLRASERSLVDRSYPLRRPIFAYINAPPARPLDPAIQVFLQHVLDRDGQRALRRHSAYLPLDRATAVRQRQLLQQAVP